MKVHCLYDTMLNVKDIKPHPKNTNKHSNDQIERLAKILNYQGWRSPIKISKRSGFITAGHGRLDAAVFNKWQQVPVNFQDYESEEQELADITSDNAIALWAELDLAKINDQFLDFKDFDLDLLGIEDFSLTEPMVAQCEEDEVPEPKEAISVLGDLYELGNHRLLCGDSTDIVQVEKLMNGEKADMVFTDPPYGMNLDTSGFTQSSNQYDAVLNDEKPFDPSAIFSFFGYCKEIFLWGADYYCKHLPDNGSWIVWDKNSGDNNDHNIGVMDGIFGSAFELCWSKQKHKREIIRQPSLRGFAVRRFKQYEHDQRVHPTQKPIVLAERFFVEWGKDATNISDVFGGSGSTLIACEKTNRKCFMMEIDPGYVDVIISRYCKHTGQTKIKRNGEEIEWKI